MWRVSASESVTCRLGTTTSGGLRLGRCWRHAPAALAAPGHASARRVHDGRGDIARRPRRTTRAQRSLSRRPRTLGSPGTDHHRAGDRGSTVPSRAQRIRCRADSSTTVVLPVAGAVRPRSHRAARPVTTSERGARPRTSQEGAGSPDPYGDARFCPARLSARALEFRQRGGREARSERVRRPLRPSALTGGDLPQPRHRPPGGGTRRDRRSPGAHATARLRNALHPVRHDR